LSIAVPIAGFVHANPWLRILVYQRVSGLWEARALERDLGSAEGRSIDLAIGTVLDRVAAHIAYDRNHGREPLSAFSPAPAWYWSVAEIASHLHAVQSSGLPITILTAAHRLPAQLIPRTARRTEFLPALVR
jgi:hypothetical protein